MGGGWQMTGYPWEVKKREANRLAVRTRRVHQRQLAVAEACQARAHLESLRRAQLEAEQEAAAARAAACPLSALMWAVKTAPKASPLEMEVPVVRAGAPPRSEFMTHEVEEVVPTVEEALRTRSGPQCRASHRGSNK